MTLQVLPTVGGSDGTWGNTLNGILSQSLTPNGFLTSVSTQTSDYSINTGSFTYSGSLPGGTWTGETVLCNPTSNTINVTLPNPSAVSGFYPMHTVKIITSTANSVTVTPTSAKIDNGTSGTAVTLPPTIGSSLTFVSDGTNWWTIGNGGIRDSNGNISTDSFISGYTSTATAAGTTTLTITSTYFQVFTGSSTQTVKMPVVSTLVTGMQYLIMNNSTGGSVTVESSGANNIIVLPPNAYVILTCISTSGTTAASWYQSQNRNVKRVYTLTTASAAPMGSCSTDIYDVAHLTGQTTTITGMTPATSNPSDGDTFRISITGNGTGITWGTSYAASNTVPLPSQTISTNRLDVGFVYDSIAIVWRCVAVA